MTGIGTIKNQLRGIVVVCAMGLIGAMGGLTGIMVDTPG